MLSFDILTDEQSSAKWHDLPIFYNENRKLFKLCTGVRSTNVIGGPYQAWSRRYGGINKNLSMLYLLMKWEGNGFLQMKSWWFWHPIGEPSNFRRFQTQRIPCKPPPNRTWTFPQSFVWFLVLLRLHPRRSWDSFATVCRKISRTLGW